MSGTSLSINNQTVVLSLLTCHFVECLQITVLCLVCLLLLVLGVHEGGAARPRSRISTNPRPHRIRDRQTWADEIRDPCWRPQYYGKRSEAGLLQRLPGQEAGVQGRLRHQGGQEAQELLWGVLTPKDIPEGWSQGIRGQPHLIRHKKDIEHHQDGSSVLTSGQAAPLKAEELPSVVPTLPLALEVSVDVVLNSALLNEAILNSALLNVAATVQEVAHTLVSYPLYTYTQNISNLLSTN